MANIKWLLIAACTTMTFSSVPAISSEQETSVTTDSSDEKVIPQTSKEYISTTLELKNKPRVALALGGGGCKCVAEIGVLRVLEANKIPIDYIIGTSTGATIGAMYASGMGVDEIEKLYCDGIVQKAMIPSMVPRVIMFPLAQLRRDLTDKGYAGLTNGDRFDTYLAKILPAQFSDLKIPFSSVSTDLISGQTVVYSKGYLPIAVQASNSLPPIYKPVAIDGKLLVDGALRANVPAKWARDSEAEVVIAVDVDPKVKSEDEKKFANMKNLLIRVSDVGLAELDLREGAEADILIKPDTIGVEIMTDDKKLLKKTVEDGERATTKALPYIMSALKRHGIETNSDQPQQ